MRAICASLALAAFLTGSAFGQTAAQLLEKGVYAQETEGNLDNAILIYRQVVNSGTNQRDVAAQAQYRLGQALLQKGDLKTAAQEFERLASTFSEYQGLISSLSAQQHGAVYRFQPSANDAVMKAVAVARFAGLGNMSFDESRKISITGKAVEVTIANPAGWITVEDASGAKYVFLTASARAMSQQGITRDSLKPEDAVTVTGVLGAEQGQFESPARADKVVVNGKTIFDRAAIPQELALSPDQIEADRRKMEITNTTEFLKARLSALQGHPEAADEIRSLQERILKLQLERPKQ